MSLIALALLNLLTAHALDVGASMDSVIDEAFPPIYGERTTRLSEDLMGAVETVLVTGGIAAPLFYHKNPATRMDEVILEGSVSATHTQYSVGKHNPHYQPFTDSDLNSLRAEGKAYQATLNRIVALEDHLSGESTETKFEPHQRFSPEDEMAHLERDHQLKLEHPDPRRRFFFEQLDSKHQQRFAKLAINREFRGGKVKRVGAMALGGLGLISGLLRRVVLEHNRDPGVFPLASLSEALFKEASEEFEIHFGADPMFQEGK